MAAPDQKKPVDDILEDSTQAVTEQTVRKNDHVSNISMKNIIPAGCNSASKGQDIPDRHSENSTRLTDSHKKLLIENQHHTSRASMQGHRQNAVDNPEPTDDIFVLNSRILDCSNNATVEDSSDIADARRPVEHYHPGSGNLVDRRQSTFEDAGTNYQPIRTTVVDHNKPTIQHTSGTTDQRYVDTCKLLDGISIHDVGKEFNDDQPGKLTNIIGSQKRTAEHNPSSSHSIVDSARMRPEMPISNIVDRHKDTVEDDMSSPRASNNNTHFTGLKPTHSGDGRMRPEIPGGKIVDRQKDTVEDDTSSPRVSNNNTQFTGLKPTYPGDGRMRPEIPGSNIVDRHKDTVEDDTSSPTVTNSNTQFTGLKPTHPENGRMGPEIPGGNIVDRHKDTVKDDTSSPTVSNSNTQFTGLKPTHSGDGRMRPEIPGSNIVDRQKDTVEDDTSSPTVSNSNTQFTGLKPTHPENGRMGPEIPGGKIVDRQKDTVEDVLDDDSESQFGNIAYTEGKCKVCLHVNIACSKDLTDQLKTTKCFAWNTPVTFGRGEGVDIFINDDHASRHHVDLMGQQLPSGEVLFMVIKNAKSKNGYILNGQIITNSNQWFPLKTGCQIKIAGLIFVVQIIMPPQVSNLAGFIIEFKLPQADHTPVTTNLPTYLPNGDPRFHNSSQYFQPPGTSMSPRLVHESFPQPWYFPPSHGTAMLPSLLYSGIPSGQLYLPRDEMVEAILRRYENREGYVRLSILRHLAFEVVGKWKELGRALGLKDWQLEMIDMDYTKSGEKSYQMLKTWVCAYPNQATHENLRKALEDITVGRGDLAEKYCTVANNGQENVNTPNGNRETNSG